MLQIWRGSWGHLTCDAHTCVHAYAQNYREWRQDMARFAGTRERWMLLCLGHRNRRPVSAPVCVHLVEQSATIANESSFFNSCSCKLSVRGALPGCGGWNDDTGGCVCTCQDSRALVAEFKTGIHT